MQFKWLIVETTAKWICLKKKKKKKVQEVIFKEK